MRSVARGYLGALAAGLVLLCAGSVFANTIAVTEFLNNAEGEDSGREWIELFNYGLDPVDLTGWTLTDQGTDSVALPSVVVPSGGYIVLANGASDMTAAQAKAVFEREWFGGVANSNVFGVTGMALGNSGDEFLVNNADPTTVWKLAYTDDENDHSTWLTPDDFSRTVWGDTAGPYIDRTGDDLGIVDLLGYERNLDTTDPLAWESDYEAIKDAGFLTSIGLDATFYDNVDNGSWGSPLTGHYTPVPEPATVALLGFGGLLLAKRRR